MTPEQKLWKVFSEYIRLRFSNENGYCKCYTCGRIRFWTGCDAGHGIGRQHKATKFDEMNVRPQCKPCNGFEGGRREEFKKQMDLEHGEGTWDRMELRSRQRTKIGDFEFNVLIKHYSGLVNDLKKRKNLKAA